MHEHQLLIFVALLLFSFGLISRIAERKFVTGPMVFLTIGILASFLVFNLFDVHHQMAPVKLVAELVLTLVLFIDATLIDHVFFARQRRRRQHDCYLSDCS